MLKLIRDFSITEIKEAIRNAKKGVNQYKYIMSSFLETDVSKDITFQRKFKGFYRINKRNDKFYKAYFSFLETCKSSKPVFSDTLEHFYKIGKPGKNKKLVYSLEFSFVSKLLATLDDNLPVWDSNVFNCFGLRNPGHWLPKKERIKEAQKIYNDLKEWYESFLKNEEGCKCEKYFDEIHPDSTITSTKKITTIKKIDFILWQLGARINRTDN